MVDGSSYDVAFSDGTCAALFDGCDSVSDFAFQSYAGALSASLALRDQVFLDSGLGLFDSDPRLTAGCDDPAFGCQALTPYNFR